MAAPIARSFGTSTVGPVLLRLRLLFRVPSKARNETLTLNPNPVHSRGCKQFGVPPKGAFLGLL